jgi:hypothetical protein
MKWSRPAFEVVNCSSLLTVGEIVGKRPESRIGSSPQPLIGDSESERRKTLQREVPSSKTDPQTHIETGGPYGREGFLKCRISGLL